MYDVIYADPAWDYAGRTQHTSVQPSGGATTHYPTMTLDKLKALKVPDLAAPNSILFLWTSSPHLAQAMSLMEAWGFKYKTIAFVWEKQRTNPSYYTLSQCEICIVGTKGRIPRPRGSRKERQFLSELRQRHSKKPDEIRNRISRMFPTQKKVELFARQSTDGWDTWGNEVPNTVQILPDA
jgi:N6-adenosine-specific RNA methylase IME4